MIISGNTFRSLLKENRFSCSLDVSFANCTGVSEFGFSGQSKTYKFSFVSGKIFDNENRYFYSYVPNSRVSIQSNFSGLGYNYSVDGEKTVYSGSKQNFYAERFYFNTTGCEIDASIAIQSVKPSLTFNLPNYFYSGDLITGYLSTNSLSGVRIFTGYFDDLASFSFQNQFTGTITSASSGQVLIRQNVTGLGNYASNVNFETSAGSYSQQFNISGLAKPYINYIFEIDEGTNTLNDLSNLTFESGLEKIGRANLSYYYDTNYLNLVPASLPLKISLSYYTGVTGYFGQITDVSLISGGNGYLSAPTVIFSGGNPTASASAVAVLGTSSLDYSSVIDVVMTNYGSGYTSAPTVIFSGGTGVINNLAPVVASGIALTSFYTKTFTGFFNLSTGDGDQFVNYRDNNYISNNSYSRNSVSITDTTSVSIQTSYTTSFDDSPMVAKLSISGINGNLIERYITGAK